MSGPDFDADLIRLRRELLAAEKRDEAARLAVVRDPEKVWDVLAIDRETTELLREACTWLAWPGIPQVGEDGARAAWLFAQHADARPELQRMFLERLAAAVERGEASPVHLAYLQDRVAIHAGRPQRYGTQFDENLQPLPIEDADEVDQRRAEVGLGPLSEYAEQLAEVYGHKPQ